jgi:hypothetical protein
MIWLTWRQFRPQALTALGALAAIAAYLVVLGLQIRDSYESDVLGCDPAMCDKAPDLFLDEYRTLLTLTAMLLIGVPALIGVFWGAPLISRELEAGTHRMVWNQSITRTRWLAVKLGVIALAGAAAAGLFSLLLTWAASPYDRLQGARFAAVNFDSRNVVPVAYAVFAVLLGTVAGLLIRRTLPAMAVTLAVFAALQVLMPFAVRPHLQAPVTTAVALTPETAQRAGGLGIQGQGGTDVTLFDYTIPGAWVLGSTHRLRTADGDTVGRDLLDSCRSGEMGGAIACLATKDLHFDVTYHPASRYWTFQWIEFSGFLVAAAALAGVGFWRVRRSVP